MKEKINLTKNVIAILFITVFITSCNDEEIPPEVFNPNVMEIKDDMSTKTLESLHEDFATALARVFNDSKEIRELIKAEALKMIDDDYDVLYMLVKDVKLKDNSTLESSLSKYMPIKDISNLIQEIPTLTIFVPELIDDSFSAENGILI